MKKMEAKSILKPEGEKLTLMLHAILGRKANTQVSSWTEAE